MKKVLITAKSHVIKIKKYKVGNPKITPSKLNSMIAGIFHKSIKQMEIIMIFC
jgi:hypothetical protein